MIVIGLSGKAESGKNSLAHLMKIILQKGDNEFEVRIVSFASALKEMGAKLVTLAHDTAAFMDYLQEHGLSCTAHIGVVSELWRMAHGLTLDDLNSKAPMARQFLQYLGTEGFRKCVDDLYWVKRAAEKIAALPEGTQVVFVPDARFPNEADYVREKLHGQVWRIERFTDPKTGSYDAHGNITMHALVPFENGLTPEQRTHVSETALDDYVFDFIIENITLDDLFRGGKVALKELGVLK